MRPSGGNIEAGTPLNSRETCLASSELDLPQLQASVKGPMAGIGTKPLGRECRVKPGAWREAAASCVPRIPQGRYLSDNAEEQRKGLDASGAPAGDWGCGGTLERGSPDLELLAII